MLPLGPSGHRSNIAIALTAGAGAALAVWLALVTLDFSYPESDMSLFPRQKGAEL